RGAAARAPDPVPPLRRVAISGCVPRRAPEIRAIQRGSGRASRLFQGGLARGRGGRRPGHTGPQRAEARRGGGPQGAARAVAAHAAGADRPRPRTRRLPVERAAGFSARALPRALASLNAAIAELVRNTPNAILIDEAAVARVRRHRACERPVIPGRIARRAFFHTARFGEYLSEPYAEIVRSYERLHKAKV